jgi:hypothetical protein
MLLFRQKAIFLLEKNKKLFNQAVTQKNREELAV